MAVSFRERPTSRSAEVDPKRLTLNYSLGGIDNAGDAYPHLWRRCGNRGSGGRKPAKLYESWETDP